MKRDSRLHSESDICTKNVLNAILDMVISSHLVCSQKCSSSVQYTYNMWISKTIPRYNIYNNNPPRRMHVILWAFGFVDLAFYVHKKWVNVYRASQQPNRVNFKCRESQKSRERERVHSDVRLLFRVPSSSPKRTISSLSIYHGKKFIYIFLCIAFKWMGFSFACVGDVCIVYRFEGDFRWCRLRMTE